jgi:hypothetical protein
LFGELSWDYFQQSSDLLNVNSSGHDVRRDQDLLVAVAETIQNLNLSNFVEDITNYYPVKPTSI